MTADVTQRVVTYRCTIDHGNGLDNTHTATGPRELAELVETMLAALPNHDARVRARMLLKRWLAHPERSMYGQALGYYQEPPPSTGDCAANRAPALCVVCGKSKARHDIDGQRADCDGYVAP